jgi:ABC-2 type transport system ATP-binding protein
LLSGFKDDQIMIISTHQVRDLNRLIESVIVIENGAIIFNQHLNNIEDTILFKNSITEQIEQESLHSELIPGGYIHLLKNEKKQPSEVELEVLFNAVVTKTDDINQLFKS